MSKLLYATQLRAQAFTTFGLIALCLWCGSLLYRYLHMPRTSPGEDFWHRQLAPEFCAVLYTTNASVFLLEPNLLAKVYGIVGTATQWEADQKWADLRWRFDLPQEWERRWDSLTVGVFAEQWQNETSLGLFTETHRVTGPSNPYNKVSSRNNSLHIFYQCTLANGTKLYLHLVVFHPVKHFLWIGSIPEATLPENGRLNGSAPLLPHFATPYEQIYDPFALATLDGFMLPADLAHLLSQLATARYVHCPHERNAKWLLVNNVTRNPETEYNSKQAIVAFKLMMQEMQMQFWIVAGTLLGWHRQCHIIPYTDDTDLGTWSKYAQVDNVNLTEEFMARSFRFYLHMELRMGEPDSSIEYSFLTLANEWKVDLFFNYPEGDQYRFPLHATYTDATYTYQSFPRYDLCSVELLGFKMLAPCTAEETIVAEYGPNWNKPNTEWDYINSPRNTGEWKYYPIDLEPSQSYR